MKGGESLSQLLKNVQGRRSSSGSDTASMIVLGFIVVGIVVVLVGTFVMVKGLKQPAPPTVSAVPVAKTSTTTTQTASDLGTDTNPLVTTSPGVQFPTVQSNLDTTGLFNKQTQQPNIADPYSKMQKIGTMLFLGPQDIMVQGIEAVNAAYQGADRELLQRAISSKSTEEDQNKLFSYNARLHLYGKRFGGNWYYFLTGNDTNAPVVNLIVKGRDCGNEQQTGCQELFDRQYYEVAPQMTQYLPELTSKILDKSPGALSLLRMKTELFPLKF